MRLEDRNEGDECIVFVGYVFDVSGTMQSDSPMTTLPSNEQCLTI